MVLCAYMMIIRGGCRPAWAAAAVDFGYARGLLAACAARAVSPGGQARVGGRTDVKLLIQPGYKVTAYNKMINPYEIKPKDIIIPKGR